MTAVVDVLAGIGAGSVLGTLTMVTVAALDVRRRRRQAPVHGIERESGEHLCGAPGGVGTDAINPAMPITCVPCQLVIRLTRAFQP